MPLKSYKKPVKKGRKYVKKSYKSSKKSLVKLIKKVSLKTQETKDTHTIIENAQLYHNVPYLNSSLLRLRHGYTDVETGTQSLEKRIGDEIYARGLSFKFWFANKLDRPDILYKVIIYKYRADTSLAAGDPFQTQGAANYMIRDINTEKFKIVKIKNLRISTSAQRIDTISNEFRGAEGHKAVKIWVPINKRIKYDGESPNASTPRFLDYAFTVVAYDSFGTLITDNIASFALNYKLYFKDA